jgi:hypothetical protein
MHPEARKVVTGDNVSQKSLAANLSEGIKLLVKLWTLPQLSNGLFGLNSLHHFHIQDHKPI